MKACKLPALIIAVPLLAFAFGGCVSKGKYVELEGRLENARKAKTTAEKKCSDRIATLEEDAATLRNRRDELLKEKHDLAAARDELESREQDRAEALRRMEENMQTMKADLEGRLEKKEAVISRIEDTLKIELVDKLFFKSGSAILSRRGAKLLAKVAPILKREADKEIRVIGHTDDLPPSRRLKKKYLSNWELSCARATAILRVLQWGYKIDPRRMSAVGVAQYRPVNIVDRKARKIRRSNRVVEIILSPLKVR